MRERNEFFERINRAEFVLSAQISPPKETSLESFYSETASLKSTGVSIIGINSIAGNPLDSIFLGQTLAKDLGLEIIPHVTLRNGSFTSILEQVYSAVGEIRNFLIVRGDGYEGSLASAAVIRKLDLHLRKKRNLNLKFGAAVNQNAKNLHFEGLRIRQKEVSGADFFMSQPVFSEDQALLATDFYREYSSKPLIVGIWPIYSAKTLENLKAGKIDGVAVPEDTREFGGEKAAELISFIKEKNLAQGVYVVAPFRKPSRIADLVANISKEH